MLEQITASCAEEFRRQDLYIFQNNQAILTLNIHPYGQKLKTLIAKKEPFYDQNGAVAGVFSNLMEVSQDAISTFYLKILQFDKHYRKKNGEEEVLKQIVAKFDFANLSERESEILFFLVRGYIAKDIGFILKISTRTVETHISNIKTKIGLDKKSELVSFCIENGFLNLIPKSILFLSLNVSIGI